MNKITDRSVCSLCLCELNVFHRSDLKHVNFNPHKTRSYKQLTNHICLTMSVRRTCFTFSESPSNRTDSRESGDDWMLLNDYIAIKNHTHWLHMTIIRSFYTPNDVYKSERCFAFIIYSHGCSFPQWSTYRCFPVLRCWSWRVFSWSRFIGWFVSHFQDLCFNEREKEFIFPKAVCRSV